MEIHEKSINNYANGGGGGVATANDVVILMCVLEFATVRLIETRAAVDLAAFESKSQKPFSQMYLRFRRARAQHTNQQQ